MLRGIRRGIPCCSSRLALNFPKAKDALCIMVRSESTQHVLLENAVLKDDVYQRQQGTHTHAVDRGAHIAITIDTLIVWTELDGTDYALSFQDDKGCNEIW